MGSNVTAVVMIVALVLFGIYRRIRRNIGWQPLVRRKLIVRTCIFSVIGLIFLSGGILHPISLISDVVGITLGVILAYYGAQLTKFEESDGRMRYLPNIWIGSTVTIIFLGRLFYRFYKISVMGGTSSFQQQGDVNGYQNMNYAIGNSWTTGLMLIMFAYYIIYYVLLLNKQKNLSKTLIKE